MRKACQHLLSASSRPRVAFLNRALRLGGLNSCDVNYRRSAPFPLHVGGTICSHRCLSSTLSAGSGAASSSAGGRGSSSPPSSPPPPGSSSIIELSDKNFAAVIQKSPVPVILDCYADWCDPCKQLTPKLEALVAQHKGRVILAKLNVDKYQEIAMDLQVRSLPSVFGIYKGKLVDMFMGMPGPKQLTDFMEKLLKLTQKGKEGEQAEEAGPENVLAHADKLLQDGKVEDAGKVYKTLYEALSSSTKDDPDGKGPPPHLQALCLAGLARCAVATNRLTEAEQLVSMIKSNHKEEIKSTPAINAALSYVELSLAAPRGKEGESTEDTLKSLHEAVKREPHELAHRHTLALKFFQLQRHEEAINQLLELLKKDKTWNDGAAKKLLLTIFESCPAELAKKGRSRLTNILFL